MEEHIHNIIRGVLRLGSEDSKALDKNFNYFCSCEIDLPKNYKVVLEYIENYFNRYASVPRVDNVIGELKTRGELDLLKKFETIKSLDVPSYADFQYSIDKVCATTSYKKLGQAIDSTYELFEQGRGKVETDDFVIEDIISDFNQKVSDLTTRNFKDDTFTSGSMSDSYEHFISQYEHKENHQEDSYGILSGVNIIDDVLGGIRRGQLMFIAGWTGSFKTGSCVNWAVSGVRAGYNVLYITMENTRSELEAQVLSCHSADPKFARFNVNSPTHSEIFKARLTPPQKKLILDRVYKDIIINEDGDYGSLYLHQPDKADFTISDALRVCLKYNNECGGELDMLVLDSPLLMVPEKGPRDNNSRNWIVRTLKTIAASFNRGKGLAILCPHQINREGYARAIQNNGVYDHRCIADLNEVERSSDGILTIFIDEVLRSSNQAKIQFLKTRSEQLPTEPYTIQADLGVRRWGDDLEDMDLDDIESGNFVEVNFDPED